MKSKSYIWLVFILVLIELIQLILGITFVLPILTLVMFWITNGTKNFDSLIVGSLFIFSILLGVLYTTNWGFLLIITLCLIAVEKLLTIFVGLGDIKFIIIITLGTLLFQLFFNLNDGLGIFVLRAILSIVIFLVLNQLINNWGNKRGYKL